MNPIKYIQETKSEMKYVTWPTKKQATAYTILVIIISLVVAAYLGAFDYFFTNFLDRFLLSL